MSIQHYKFVPVYTAYNECSLQMKPEAIEAHDINNAANQVSKRAVLDMYRDAISDESDLQAMYDYILEFVGDICIHDPNHATIGYGEEEVLLVLAPNSPFYNIVEIDQEEWVEGVKEQWYELFGKVDYGSED